MNKNISFQKIGREGKEKERVALSRVPQAGKAF